MSVTFKNPETQARLDRCASETGCSVDELVENVMTSYLDALAETRDLLNSRYDDIVSGRVKLIPGAEVVARLRERSANYRRQHS